MGSRSSGRLVEKLLSALDGAAPEECRPLLTNAAEEGREAGEPVHSRLLRLLAHLEYSEEEAQEILAAAVRHRQALRSLLGRDVGTRVALFDHLVSVDRRILNPKIIEIPAFERIERSAVTDHLTGLYNRLHFDARLKTEVGRARRFGQHLSLLLLDLDDFKAVNDRAGHPAGDQVLREVGRLIVEQIRDIDIGARYGGEEFAIILPETPRSGAYVVAERLRRQVAGSFRRRGSGARITRTTISGGLATFPEDSEDADTLIERADRALYRAKRAGKNAINIYFLEKRRAERIDVGESGMRAVVQLQVSRGEVRRNARVKNISQDGLLIELSEPVPVGSEIKVSFSLGLAQAYTIPSTVVRLAQPAVNGKRRRFEAGLRFQRRARSLKPELTRLARQHAAAG